MKSVLIGSLSAAVMCGSVATMSEAAMVFEAGDTSTHAFFLPGNDASTPGTYWRWFDTPQATLTTEPDSWETATAATLEGQIFNEEDPGTFYDVEIEFVNGRSFDEFNGVDGFAKVENDTPSSDVENWRFFDLGDTAQLTYASGPGGAEETINIEFFKLNYVFQVGIGASNKFPNDVLGASAWIANADGTPWSFGGNDVDTADINITLVPVPEPTAAALIALPALAALRRRRQQA